LNFIEGRYLTDGKWSLRFFSCQYKALERVVNGNREEGCFKGNAFGENGQREEKGGEMLSFTGA
jgi:hypothetical protein